MDVVFSPSRSDYYLDADVYDRSGRRSVYDHEPNESASEMYRSSSSYALNSSRSVSKFNSGVDRDFNEFDPTEMSSKNYYFIYNWRFICFFLLIELCTLAWFGVFI